MYSTEFELYRAIQATFSSNKLGLRRCVCVNTRQASLQNLILDIKRLDGLPFPSNHFDFIRIAGMGLAIPEDQWQPVLEVCILSFFSPFNLVR